jgi:hypothetical protein
MTTYTGTVKNVDVRDFGRSYPFFNPLVNYMTPAGQYRNRKVRGFEIAGTAAAIAADLYNYNLFLAPRACVLDGAYIVFPVGVDGNATNYNTYALKSALNGAVFSLDNKYGIVGKELVGLPEVQAFAKRVTPDKNQITFSVQGVAAGQQILTGTLVFVVYHYGTTLT